MPMNEKDIVAHAVKFWLKKKHMKQNELAEAARVEPSTVSQIANGHRLPSLELAGRMAGVFGISLPEFFACKDDELPELAFVPLVKAVPRAGTGGLELDGEQIRLYSFHNSFLMRKQGGTDSMRLFKIDGDSMEPTLHHGDMIMINLRQTHISSGAIYLLRLEGELMVKRLENRPGGLLLIRSDNPAYDDITIAKDDETIDAEVFGRMVWSCREY
ncbi:LexA family transcriptional regulator [Desulfovibrio sp. OttesenSCG-928-A18]|nr:LexA family transcriptional regulator [Desulfovibrio sp. OttesenSCG-928-A18]